MESNELSEEYLEEIENRHKSTTPGPWISYVEGREFLSGDSVIVRDPGPKGFGEEEDLYLSGIAPEDQDFIAHAWQDIPLLLNEIKQLKDLLAKEERDRNIGLLPQAYLDEVRRLHAETSKMNPPWNLLLEAKDNLGKTLAETDYLEIIVEDARGKRYSFSGATVGDFDFMGHLWEDIRLLLSEVERLRRLIGCE